MEELRRNYNLSNPELCMLVSNMVGFMGRDSVEFLSRGVSETDVTAYESLGNAFEIFPADEEYKGLVTIAVDEKDTLKDDITRQIQLIAGFFDQVWGVKSGQYKRLAITNIQTQKEAVFLFRSREVVRISTEYLADLTAAGLTQAIIDALAADAQSFEDKLNAVADAKALRDTKAAERTENGNALYEYAVEYAKIGKLIWKNVSEAKHNDYVIYPNQQTGMGKVKNLEYEIPVLTALWDALATALDYQLEARDNVPEADWAVVYEGEAVQTIYDPGAGDWLFRCRGRNDDGYGDWSDELNVVIA